MDEITEEYEPPFECKAMKFEKEYCESSGFGQGCTFRKSCKLYNEVTK